MSKWNGTEECKLVGEVVKEVWLDESREEIRFVTEDGDPVEATCYGDCCSITWIEDVQGLEQLIGGKVVKVEDVESPATSEECKHLEDPECIQFYGCKITTDKGYCLIDYRNSSNGYYGGDLMWNTRRYGPRTADKFPEGWTQLVP